MTGSEMAAQLEKVAEGARNGNSACLAVAREMLAHRRMLHALQDVMTCHAVVDTQIRDAIAAAKRENNG